MIASDGKPQLIILSAVPSGRACGCLDCCINIVFEMDNSRFSRFVLFGFSRPILYNAVDHITILQQ